MSHTEKAVDRFKNDFNCAQSVLAAFAPELGLEESLALKVACGFGAGMGCTARTCGAVTGAFMVIGLKYGKFRTEDREGKPNTYKQIKAFIQAFEARHGSIECLKIMPMDIRTDAGMAEARAQGVFKDVCLKVVKDAVGILETQIFK